MDRQVHYHAQAPDLYERYDAENAYKPVLDALTQNGDLTTREAVLAMLCLFHKRRTLTYLFGSSSAYLSKCYRKACRVLEKAGVPVPPWQYIE